MDFFRNSFNQGFADQSYGQWFLFFLLAIAFWGVAVSLNAYARGAAKRII